MIRAFIEDYRILRAKHPRHVSCLKWMMVLSLTLNAIFIGGFLYQKRQTAQFMLSHPDQIKSTVVKPAEEALKTNETVTQVAKDHVTEAPSEEKDNVLATDNTAQRLAAIEKTVTQIIKHLKLPQQSVEETATEIKAEEPTKESVSEPTTPENKPTKFSLNVFKKQPDQS